MDFAVAALLFGAGVAGGVVNAIAGGATLITFPAMLAAGLPPVIANASNALAVTPGHLFAALADRKQLPARGSNFAIAIVAAAIGGAVGALLLLVTPERVFVLLVPVLIALATLVFAFGRRIQTMLGFGSAGQGAGARAALMLPVTVYGGYFGAGLGVMLLAVLSITGRENIRATNAFKNLLATATSLATITIFIVQGVIRWPETLVMLAGAVAGGILGGRLITVLPANIVRGTVIVLGIAMTIVYAARYWF
jgi:uncharacterized membrane protein YfcA